MSLLSDEIKSLLSSLLTSSNWDQAADEDRFEGYIFALILKAAAKEGANLYFENRKGPFAGSAMFRTGPGHLWSKANDYTHAVIEFHGKPPLEAHVGVYVSGKSKLQHEADVMVLGRAVAKTCRIEETDPSYNDAILFMECKFYATDPGISLGREFLGLSAEFGTNATSFVTNRPAERLQRLFKAHTREWGHDIVPAQPNDVDRLVGFAQRAFTRYKAK